MHKWLGLVLIGALISATPASADHQGRGSDRPRQFQHERLQYDRMAAGEARRAENEERRKALRERRRQERVERPDGRLTREEREALHRDLYEIGRDIYPGRGERRR